MSFSEIKLLNLTNSSVKSRNKHLCSTNSSENALMLILGLEEDRKTSKNITSKKKKKE